MFVIAANLVEVIFRNGEETTSKRGRPAERCRLKTASCFYKKKKKRHVRLTFYRRVLLDWEGFVFPPFLLVIWQTLPTKRQAPVKVASVVVLAVRGWFDELKSVEVDRGYVGTHDGGAVLGDPGQQRLQPPVKALTCDRCGTDAVSIQQPPRG